jgi:cell division protein FtsW (lipid II flippase)
MARAGRVRRRHRGAGRLEAPQLTLSSRNRELAFLVVVGVLTAIGFASVYIARQSVVSTASLTYAAIFFGVFLAAHFVARATVPFADPYLLPIAGLLCALGVTEIYRLDPNSAFRQGFWIIAGVVLFAATLFFLRHDYRRIESYKYLFGLTAIGLLALPILPVLGQTVNGSRLWVHAGPLQVQPGELAKIALIVFLAGYLREKREVLAQGRLKDFGPLLVIWGMAILVLLETRDLGGGLLYFGIFLAMLFVATGRLAFVAIGLTLFLVGSIGVWKVTPHVQERVTDWRHPWTDHAVYCPSAPGHLALRQNCQSYQIVQSMYSIAHGGYTGTGLGRGTVLALNGKNELIPYAKTDFIFSVIAQEVGLVGTAAFLLVYMVFVLRGIRIALLAQDGFSKLLALGLTFAFALQAFIIVGGILRIIPLTGITLPFVSYGGSSVVANFVLLAGLLLVSNRANREALR